MTALRKTFSGVGRPRKAGAREPNGQPQRISTAEKKGEVLAFAAKQPHRLPSVPPGRGILPPDHPIRATLIGRLIADQRVVLDHLTYQDLSTLAETYVARHARYQRALASRRPLAVTDGAVLRPDDPAAEAKEYEAALASWAEISRVLRDAGERVEKAFDAIVLQAAPEADLRLLPAWMVLSLPAAFSALHGLLSGLTSRPRSGYRRD